LGKYSGVLEDKPRWKNENPKYQEKIENRRKEIEAELGDLALSPHDLARTYIAIRTEKEAKEDELKALELDFEAIIGLLADRYEIEGVSSLKLETGDTVRVEFQPYSVVKDREKNWQWCKDNGLERSMNINWQTLNALVKDRILTDGEIPDGVEVTVKPKVVFSKA
jgi:hypothetical protein